MLFRSQEDISRIAVNFGFTYPVLTKHANESINIKVDNEIEALYNFKISNNAKLSTGVGFQYEIHHKTQEAEKVMMVDCWVTSVEIYILLEINVIEY